MVTESQRYQVGQCQHTFCMICIGMFQASYSPPACSDCKRELWSCRDEPLGVHGGPTKLDLCNGNICSAMEVSRHWPRITVKECGHQLCGLCISESLDDFLADKGCFGCRAVFDSVRSAPNQVVEVEQPNDVQV